MKDIIFNDTAFEFYNCSYMSDCQQDVINNGIYQIWYIKQGAVHFSGKKGTVDAKTGDTLYLPQEERGVAVLSGDKPISILKFRFRYFPSVNHYTYPSQVVPTDEKILSMMAEIPLEPTVSSITVWKFYEYLDELQKNLRAIDHKRVKKIEMALEYMNTHIKYDVPDLAKLCSMSESGFYTAFREIVGTTPIEEKHRQQAIKAESLLLATDLSIDEISLKVGFSSTQHFRKIFKNRYGVTPKEFRKNRYM